MRTLNLIAACVFVTLFAWTTSAQTSPAGGFDFTTTLLARTYAPALSVNPTLGYGQKLWGDLSTPWYGFVRPTVTGVLSPSLYEGKIGLEIFPVSIFGLDIKRTTSRRFNETKGQDCNQVQCLGTLDYTDVSLQSFLGFADYFASTRWTRTFFDAVSDRTRPVYELGASVLLSPNGEAGDYVTIIAGRKFGPTFSVGGLVQIADFHSSGHHQEGQYVIVKSDLSDFGLNDLSATVGLGRFKSDLNVAEVSAILSLTYTSLPAIGFGR